MIIYQNSGHTQLETLAQAQASVHVGENLENVEDMHVLVDSLCFVSSKFFFREKEKVIIPFSYL